MFAGCASTASAQDWRYYQQPNRYQYYGQYYGNRYDTQNRYDRIEELQEHIARDRARLDEAIAAAATEAMYLMARHAFETLGYRRYEWKCNALNQASRRAALRLGFTFQGMFRQHMIVKGRNRDTAWFSMLDSEWAARKTALERGSRQPTSMSRDASERP